MVGDDAYREYGRSEQRFARHIGPWQPGDPVGGEPPDRLNDDDGSPDGNEQHQEIPGPSAGDAQAQTEGDKAHYETAGDVKDRRRRRKQGEVKQPVAFRG